MVRAAALATLLAAAALRAWGAGPVVLEGVVADEATRRALVARAAEVFGAEAVEDRLQVAPVAVPPGWRETALRLLDPALRQVRAGRLDWQGGTLQIEGEVADESVRREVLRALAAGGLRPDDGLRPGTAAAPAVEFEAGSARLGAAAQRQLDATAARLAAAPKQRLAIVGHTDDAGAPEANLALSLQRAQAVRAYLEARGIDARRLEIRGAGAGEPRADNTTPEGRARNRRIELRALD